MLPTESTDRIDHTVHVWDRYILRVAAERMKIATLQSVLSERFKIAALKMTMGVRCIVALFFSARPWGGCCPCVRFLWSVVVTMPFYV